jgi:uroporphyrinogen III methyltransferase/synthase
MSPSINILTQNDALHKSFIEELKQKHRDYFFQVSYINHEEDNKLSNHHPVLTELTTELAVLHLPTLPFPLNEKLSVISLLKSDTENYFAVLSLSDINSGYEFLARNSHHKNLGKVYLVGAGQSSKELLTNKATSLIKQADIIFYDSLIDKSILELSDAKKVFVGKRANKHFKDQKDINQLMLDAAFKHKTIVRVKGGDPMIFGHAGEEIAFLESKLISVETVPGISSPLGAAAQYNLPLTLRNISNSVSFVSAHEKSKILVPETDTIVYFMGATNLPKIAKALKKNGKPDTFPLTLFYNIGAADQEVFYETVESVLIEGKSFKSPLLIVAGEVGNRQNWHKAFNYKPKVLFTGSHIAKYAHLGYVYHQPMIEISELQDYTEIDTVISDITKYDWLVFTSMYAVEHFFNRLLALGKDARYLANKKVASIGKVTSAKLKKYGVIPDLQATLESSEGLIELFNEHKIYDANILIPRSNLAHNFLPEQLEKLGNHVQKLTVYENIMPENIKKVEVENFDQVIFTSPSGVDNFLKVYTQLPLKPQIITRGKETLKRIQKYK